MDTDRIAGSAKDFAGKLEDAVGDSVLTLTDDSQMSSDLRIWANEENRTNFDRRR